MWQQNFNIKQSAIKTIETWKLKQLLSLKERMDDHFEQAVRHDLSIQQGRVIVTGIGKSAQIAAKIVRHPELYRHPGSVYACR
ncbi:MAG: hypothetical protein U5L09_09940 [Bacteroidales bacterium]|nr:hypothetical protein [Bacteroidales bacterium]